MYYPGAADVRAAAAIHVTPGADLDGIDLRLNALRYYRVRGRIVDPRTGNPPRQVRLRLSTANGGSIRRGQRYDVESGSFEMWNLSPGVFSVIAELAPPPGEESPPFRASTTVVIADADVEGVALVLAAVAAGTSIGGRVSLDAGAAAQPAFPLELLRVQLSAASTDEMNWDAPQLDAQGAIRLKNIQPGEYWLMLDGIPTGFYIKEARFGGVDALNRPVVAPSVLEAHHTLDIVIGSKVGKVEGTVLDSNGRPAPLAQVVLIPNRNRHRSELFRPVTADAAGHFSITNITPGDYRLAAWETLEPYEFFDPARMAQAEALGKPVQVTESSSENLTLRLIPAAAP
jgi:hypothetical protein